MLIINYKFLFLLLLVACVYCRKRKERETVTVQQVAGRFEHAEGPHWDHRTQKLYFVDIDKQRLHRLDPATDTVTSTFIENGPVGVAVPVNDMPDKFVAGAGTDFVLVSWDADSNLTRASTQVLSRVDTDHPGNRWNDGKVDSCGRFWGGTIGPEVNSRVEPDQAAFYCIKEDLKPEKKISPVTNSNGLAWNDKDDTLYYIDTPTLQVAQYDFDPHSGNISNKRIAFDLRKHNISGLPDGMTIDTDGNLWIALYDGGRVIKADPRTGALLQSVEMPVSKVTSVTFGGPLLNVLYVTTSSRGLSNEQLGKQPYAGYVFAVKGLRVRGQIANMFKLAL